MLEARSSHKGPAMEESKVSPDELEESFALPLSSRTIKALPTRRHKRPRLLDPLPLPPPQAAPFQLEAPGVAVDAGGGGPGGTDGSGSTAVSGDGSPATPPVQVPDAVPMTAEEMTRILSSLDNPFESLHSKGVIARLTDDLTQGIANLTLRSPSAEADPSAGGPAAVNQARGGYQLNPDLAARLAEADPARSVAEIMGLGMANKKKRKVPSASAGGVGFSSCEHIFAPPSQTSATGPAPALFTESAPPASSSTNTSEPEAGVPKPASPPLFREQAYRYPIDRYFVPPEADEDDVEGEDGGIDGGGGGRDANGAATSGGGFTIGGLGPLGLGGGTRGESYSAVSLAKALTSHHVKTLKRPISDPKHYGHRLRKETIAKSAVVYSGAGVPVHRAPSTPPLPALPPLPEHVNVGPPLTPAATPERKPATGKKGRSGQKKVEEARPLVMPWLMNLYDPTVPLRAIPGLVPGGGSTRPPVGVLTPPSSEGYLDDVQPAAAAAPTGATTDGKKRKLFFARFGVATGEPDDDFEVSAFRFDFSMPIEVLTRRMADLRLAIEKEKEDRERAIKQAMLIATEAQAAARKAAAESAKASAAQSGDPTKLTGAQADAATATTAGPTTPGQAAAKKGGAKKKKGKKKRSAHANANNVHHRDNYVPSRYPASSGGGGAGAGQKYLSSYHHHSADEDGGTGGGGVRVVTPSELIADEVEAGLSGTEPAYRKDHVFIDPTTTFPGVEPHLDPHSHTSPADGEEKVLAPPAHAQLGPSAVASYFADPEEWVCAFCEYELWFGEELGLSRTLRQRKTVLKRRRKARERAARAAGGGGGAGANPPTAPPASTAAKTPSASTA